MSKTAIYKLIDPRNNEVKYIGKSVNPNIRFKTHLYEAKKDIIQTRKARWIRKLIGLGLIPIFEVIEYVDDFEYWEEYYIRKYKLEGCDLVNWDDKGKGTCGRMDKEMIISIKKKLSKCVYQYKLDGEFVSEYPSTREAAKLCGLSHAGISRVCRGLNNHVGGFIFKYSDFIEEIKPIINPNAEKKKVVLINEFGDIIAEFESIADAARITGIDSGNISRVCNGIRKKTKNKIFKFKDCYGN